MSTYVELLMHSLHRRRMSLATASMVLSVLLHIFLIIMALIAPSKVPFLRTFLTTEPPPREPPMRLQEVKAEPEPVTTTGSGTAEARGSAAAIQPADITRLAASPNTAELAPPAAKPGTLAEEAPTLSYTPPAPAVQTWRSLPGGGNPALDFTEEDQLRALGYTE